MEPSAIYHGSDHAIEAPAFGFGSKNNDYGRAFYCTYDKALAYEWACKQGNDGFVNAYDFDTEGLRVLDLTSQKYSVLNWIAILLDNRTFDLGTDMAASASRYLRDNYLPQINRYDFIVGWRADDSYFSYASAFVENTLSVQNLAHAITLGNLGVQVAVKSRKAFERLKFKEALAAPGLVYFPKFKERDKLARRTWQTEVRKRGVSHEDIFIADLMRGAVSDDDLQQLTACRQGLAQGQGGGL
jgi:hypothetical protein